MQLHNAWLCNPVGWSAGHSAKKLLDLWPSSPYRQTTISIAWIMSPVPVPLSMRLIRDALLLVAGFVCASGRASAECGDYVRIGGESLTSPVAHADRSRESPRPCRGLFCSARSSSTPATPPASQIRPAEPRTSATAVVAFRVANGARVESLPSLAPRPTPGHPASVFHPPRVG